MTSAPPIRFGIWALFFAFLSYAVAFDLGLQSTMTRFIAAQLFGLSGIDIPTIAGACFLLLVVALAATLVPARRATRVDPVVALRQT